MTCEHDASARVRYGEVELTEDLMSRHTGIEVLERWLTGRVPSSRTLSDISRKRFVMEERSDPG